ncbi:MAG TPA: RimK/LysX family protein [Prolixibacteraceae bacterium]|nr:RimK/LysX family protein [Prolixibacteraceae bacterium]
MNEKILIGRKDKACFPELDIEYVPVKIDTGAYTSSIHCHHIEEIEHEGKQAISFELFDPEHSHYKHQKFIVTDYKQKKIKSSSGHSEKRYLISTSIKLFNKVYPIQMSLTERGSMKYPVLLGRKILKKKFIVDPAKINLSFKHEHK